MGVATTGEAADATGEADEATGEATGATGAAAGNTASTLPLSRARSLRIRAMLLVSVLGVIRTPAAFIASLSLM